MTTPTASSPRRRRRSIGAALYSTVWSSPDSDPSQGVDLVKYSVSEQSRTKQDPNTVAKLESRVIAMLGDTTGGQVHIDNTCVDRVAGETIITLSHDSCYERHRVAIEEYMAKHFDAHIWSISCEQRLVTIKTEDFPRPYQEKKNTLVITVRAIAVAYSAPRYFFQKGTTMALWMLWGLFVAADILVLRKSLLS